MTPTAPTRKRILWNALLLPIGWMLSITIGAFLFWAENQGSSSQDMPDLYKGLFSILIGFFLSALCFMAWIIRVIRDMVIHRNHKWFVSANGALLCVVVILLGMLAVIIIEKGLAG